MTTIILYLHSFLSLLHLPLHHYHCLDLFSCYYSHRFDKTIYLLTSRNLYFSTFLFYLIFLLLLFMYFYTIDFIILTRAYFLRMRTLYIFPFLSFFYFPLHPYYCYEFVSCYYFHHFHKCIHFWDRGVFISLLYFLYFILLFLFIITPQLIYFLIIIFITFTSGYIFDDEDCLSLFFPFFILSSSLSFLLT